MFGSLGFGEILLIAVIALVFFGGNRMAELGKGLGEGVRNFKRGLRDEEDTPAKPLPGRSEGEK